MFDLRRITHDRVTNVFAVVALMLFTFWTQKHVGESYFLADQVDQLQKYEALLRLEPEGLWGPAMSGTQARALGPFAAVVFGLPVTLGLGIDSIHALTSLLLVVATIGVFFELRRVNHVLAWTWLIVFTSMRMVWWSAAMFWVNTLLLPLGLALLALSVACLRNPTLTKLSAVVVALMFALQQHLVAIVAVPPVLLLIAGTWRDAIRRPPSRVVTVVLLAVVVIAILPYLVAEGDTGFRNTRAIFSHVSEAAPGNADGRKAAMDTLVLATDPMALFPVTNRRDALLTGSAVALGALALMVFKQRRTASNDALADEIDVLLWLVAAAILGVVCQALFFLLMARPLNGLHYAMLLAPWYAIPPAVLLAGLIPTKDTVTSRLTPTVLATLAVFLLIVRAPLLADRYAERTPWSYRAITTALDTLCQGEAVQTVEGPGLIDDLTPQYDSVLRYLMKRGLSRCRYDPAADVIILANQSGDFGDVLLENGKRFKRELVLSPGLARYRLMPEPLPRRR